MELIYLNILYNKKWMSKNLSIKFKQTSVPKVIVFYDVLINGELSKSHKRHRNDSFY